MNPWPGPRSVLLVDNCRIHSVKELVSRVGSIGAKVIFLEPYDPQHMPIEVGFRALKRCAQRRGPPAPARQFTPAAPPTICALGPGPGRWIRKHRVLLGGRPVHEQMHLAAECVSTLEAHQAFAAAGF